MKYSVESIFIRYPIIECLVIVYFDTLSLPVGLITVLTPLIIRLESFLKLVTKASIDLILS